MRLATGRVTDQGRLRSNNEDASLVDPDHMLYAVADGMGGHRGGEVASHTAIEALRAAFASGSTIDAAIVLANDAVIARAEGNDELEGMGTTLTAVTDAGIRRLLIGHVGDSRAYLLHDGELVRITDDHSLVEELVREGRLTPEQAESHPQRAIVTRALGVDTEVDVDLYPIDVVTGDRLLICSDGLTVMVRDRDVERIASNEPDPQRAAEALVAAANDAGGEDNITVIVIDVIDADVGAEAAVVEPVEAAAETPEAPAAVARPKGSRLRTVRGALLVVLPLVLIIGIAAAVLGWYARHSYYVGASGTQVVIFKGVPGGVLGWDPTVDRRTGIAINTLPQLERDRVQSNATRGSLATARAFVDRLEAATTTLPAPTTTTTATIPLPTTTVLPGPPSTVAP